MEPFLIDVWSFKRATIGEETLVWNNHYTFEALDGWNISGAHNALDAVTGAENHLLLQHTALTLRVAAPTGIAPNLSWDTPTYTFARLGDRGGRSLFPGSEPLSLDYALVIDQQTLIGRSGNLYHRGALQDADVTKTIDGQTLLNEKQYPENRPTEFYDDRLMNAFWKPVVVRREEWNQAATDPRAVVGFRYSDVVKLRSIADAQKRKTYVALSYKRLAEEMVDSYCTLDYYVLKMLEEYPDKIPSEKFINMGTLISMLGAQFKDVSKYWSEGIAPSISEEWRPGAGLDPHSTLALSWCVAAISSVAEAIKRISEVLEVSGNEIDSIMAIPIRARVWGLGLALAKVLTLCRFTGTPIPHTIV